MTQTTKVPYLTTIDNPFHPYKQHEAWLAYDKAQGYNTINYLARVAKTSDALSDYENLSELERAIDEIIKYDFTNMYIKVMVDEDEDDTI